jgi:hypothetical protein
MAATYTTYTGNGVLATYSIPFPYSRAQDVKVYVGGALQVATADYTFASASTIEFRTAPTNGALIVVRRISEQDSRLVDFVNGAVLTEADLDLSATQLFYMIQENRDLLDTIIDGTFTSVGSTLLDEVAEDVLSTAAALEIQTRIADIDAAGQMLLDEMMARRVIGEVSDTYDAFILDVDTVKVTPTETLAERFTALVAATATAAAAVVTEASARASGDSANASLITALEAVVDDNSASITILAATSVELEDGVADLEARYGVTLNVNNYITGFAQHNDGVTGTFDILTDKFRVVDPDNDGQNPTVVFAIESGNVLLQNLYLHQLTVGATGHIKRGKTSASDTTSGFWLGYDGSSGYDFHIGDATSSLWWDQSAGSLRMNGDVSAGRAAYKLTSTSRDNTTTFADDPDLSFPLTVGTHLIEIMVIMNEEASSSSGMKSQINFTGTGNLRGVSGFRWDDGGSAVMTHVGTLSASVGIHFDNAAANIPVYYDLKIMYTVATAGTFSIQWAQKVSNSNNTAMIAGSYIKSTRLL